MRNIDDIRRDIRVAKHLVNTNEMMSEYWKGELRIFEAELRRLILTMDVIEGAEEDES